MVDFNEYTRPLLLEPPTVEFLEAVEGFRVMK